MTVRSTGPRNDADGGPDVEGAVAAVRNLTAMGVPEGAEGARRSCFVRRGNVL